MKEDPVKTAEREAQEQMRAAQAQAEQQQAAAMRQVEQQKKDMKKQVAKGMALGLLTGLGTKLFFWLKNKKTIFALLLGTALLTTACKTTNDDVNLKRFNITVDEITATSIHVNIVPPDEQMPYVYCLFNEATFNLFKSEQGGLEDALKIFAESHGTYTGKWDNLYPNTKYVLCIGEENEETNEIVGDVEYTRFQTPSMEAQLPDNQQPLAMTGECWFYAEKKNIIIITGSYPIPDGDGEQMKMYMFFVSNKLTGHFTTDDMFGYLFIQSNLEVVDSDNHQEASYAICGADITGSFNDATGTFAYTGTCDLISEQDGLMRLPVSIQCTEYIAEDK